MSPKFGVRPHGLFLTSLIFTNWIFDLNRKIIPSLKKNIMCMYHQLNDNLEQWPHLNELVDCYKAVWVKDDLKYGHYEAIPPLSFQSQVFEGPDTDIETGEDWYSSYFYICTSNSLDVRAENVIFLTFPFFCRIATFQAFKNWGCFWWWHSKYLWKGIFHFRRENT